MDVHKVVTGIMAMMPIPLTSDVGVSVSSVLHKATYTEVTITLAADTVEAAHVLHHQAQDLPHLFDYLLPHVSQLTSVTLVSQTLNNMM